MGSELPGTTASRQEGSSTNKNVGHRDCRILAAGRQARVLQQTATLGASSGAQQMA